MSSDDHDPSAANDETSHGSGGPPLNNDVPLPSDLLNDADFNGIMPLDAQDLAFTLDEILRESGGSSFINSDPLPSKTSDNFNFGEWQKGSEEEGDWDATSSFPVESSGGAMDGNLDITASFPVQTSGPQGAVDRSSDTMTSFPMQTSAPQGAVDGNSDTTSSFPIPMSAPQGASDIIDKPGPSTLAPFSLASPFTHIRKLLGAKTSSPTPAQDIESVGGSNATGAHRPPSHALSTPPKRKRSDREDDPSPLAPKPPRKRQARNPSWHHFSQPGSPTMIVDGQPCFMAAAHAPAPAPAPASGGGGKTFVGGKGSAKLGNEERHLDSNRMRQMIKKGLAETEGLREGERWECRVPGGRYSIECLSGEVCAMQWFGEVVFV